MSFSKRIRIVGLVGILALGAYHLGHQISTRLDTNIPVSGSSMEPLIYDGDKVTITRFTNKPPSINIGDIVLALAPNTGERILKQVYGLPGQTLTFTTGKKQILQPGEYWLQGQNLALSQDSRHHGLVTQLIGKVILINNHKLQKQLPYSK
jgi:signal peptidase I